MNASVILDMKTNLFPFGEYPIRGNHYNETRRMFVRKRIILRNVNEKALLEEKLKILKKICHRNVINIKAIE